MVSNSRLPIRQSNSGLEWTFSRKGGDNTINMYLHFNLSLLRSNTFYAPRQKTLQGIRLGSVYSKNIDDIQRPVICDSVHRALQNTW
jgi:hypothetical protein